MKRPEYVAAAVTACVTARGGGTPDLEQLQAVFSRGGFTDGYFTGKLGPRMFGIRQKEDVAAAQGVLGELAALYRRETQRVPVSFRFEMQRGKPALLTCRDEQGRSAAVSGAVPEEALSRPTTGEAVEKSLNKTGSTPYRVERTELAIDEGLMLPVSALNAMRREALEKLSELRGNSVSYTVRKAEIGQLSPVGGPEAAPIPQWRGRFHALEGLTQDIVAPLDRVVLPLVDVFNAFNNRMLKSIPLEKIEVEIPRILFEGGENVGKMLKEVRNYGIRRAVVSNIGAVRLAKEAGMELTGGWALNLFNPLALQEYRAMGLSEGEVSIELSAARIRRLAQSGALPCGMVSYGYLPLMIFRSCPVKNAMGCKKCGKQFRRVTDRTGAEFFVDCEPGGQCSCLYNGTPLYLADRLGDFAGVSWHTLYFTRESPEEIKRVIEAYQKGLPWEETGLTGGKNAHGAFTRGLYFRSVM